MPADPKHTNLITHYVIPDEASHFVTLHTQAGGGLRHKTDFIYMDPPSHTDRRYGKRTRMERWSKEFTQVAKASRTALKRTGVLAVSATDSEMPRIRHILDDTYGVEHFIGMITIDLGGGMNNSRLLSRNHEYLILYAKNMPALMKEGKRWRIKREGLEQVRKQERKLRALHQDNYNLISTEMRAWLQTQSLSDRLKKFYNADERGLYTGSDLSAPNNGAYFDITHPFTQKPVAYPRRGWGVSKENFQQLITEDRIMWGEDETTQPLRKLYLKDTPDQVLRTVWKHASRSPEKLLKRILGGQILFDEVKDLDFMKTIIEVMTPEDSLIVDLYAGSGTTGHAVLDLNYETGSTRKFLLVEDNPAMYEEILQPRIEAVRTGKWADRQHRPRKSVIQSALPDIGQL